MSMVIDLLKDHNIYLCEGGPVYNGGVQPTPITYLTQWKIVGNSEVHGVGNLTSWKVSGNSVVDNNTILSCGDYSEVDGKYHVKISDGVTIFDIPLDAPLRKVGDVADTIEFPSETEGKALVTRNVGSDNREKFVTNNMSSQSTMALVSLPTGIKINNTASYLPNILIDKIPNTVKYSTILNESLALSQFGTSIEIRNTFIEQTKAAYDIYFTELGAVNIIYELATPTTELVDVSTFAVSPTDTYTSANIVPYSAFEHTENKEIWSCGEYSATDGKYHILVQPQGGSIADIALDEPLRKVNNVADTIEFPSGTEDKALVTRPLDSVDLGTCNYGSAANGFYSDKVNNLALKPQSGQSMDVLCTAYPNSEKPWVAGCMGISFSGSIWIGDNSYESATAIKNALAGVEMIYKLATPTTELVDAPQIEEAESYSMVISQGGKAISWSGFSTESE